MHRLPQVAVTSFEFVAQQPTHIRRLLRHWLRSYNTLNLVFFDTHFRSLLMEELMVVIKRSGTFGYVWGILLRLISSYSIGKGHVPVSFLHHVSTGAEMCLFAAITHLRLVV
jgi:hypothetical protein